MFSKEAQMIVDGFRHQKGRPGCQTALVLSLAKITIFFNNLLDSRRSLSMLEQKLKSRKKNCTFFSLNLFSIPRDIPWHLWKNLLTSKRGHSGGWNFFTKFCQIWMKTSGGSRDLNFDPICKCHTISETSWCPYDALHNLIDLWGHDALLISILSVKRFLKWYDTCISDQKWGFQALLNFWVRSEQIQWKSLSLQNGLF